MFDPPGEAAKREQLRALASAMAKAIDLIPDLEALLTLETASPYHRAQAFEALKTAREGAKVRDHLLAKVLRKSLSDDYVTIISIITALCGYAHTRDQAVQLNIRNCLDRLAEHRNEAVRKETTIAIQSIGWLN